MRVTMTVAETRETLARLRRKGAVGFVPTMGALHRGHRSLIGRARKECEVVAVSIFVNPTQFGPHEDFDRYPRMAEQDQAMCREAGADVVFMPSVAEIYPDGHATYVVQEKYTEPFEGALRRGHFHGVCTVCCKLFHIVRPDVVYLGQKDYQQCVVLQRMVRDLRMDLEVRVCPTVRDDDGVALSSRNAYLSPAERREAVCLVRSLRKAEEMVAGGERRVGPILEAMREIIAASPMARPDYVAIADAESLRELRAMDGPAVALVAVRLGQTRLIDNTLLNPR